MRVNNLPAPIRGTIYGVVLNDHESVERLGATLNEAPYKAPPKAPILYIKPANTLSANGAAVALPQGAGQVEIGATVGVVIGMPASRLSLENALTAVQGYVVVADLSLPHSSYYRPAIREKCFDGSCVFASEITAASSIQDASTLQIQTLINGKQVGQWSLGELVRSVPELLRDVSEFMTLNPGDVLLLGVKWQAPTAAPGDTVKISVPGAGLVEFSIHSEAGSAA